MLRSLLIRDFVIVEQTTLDFAAGFTALTGETGAGKSILIDALGAILGERADPAVVRQGCRQAEVSAEFDVSSCAAARAWLADAGLEGEPGQCLVRRLVEAGGRSRGFVNGSPVTATQLRDLGELLVDIHGQHAHQSLLRPPAQRDLLDGYGGLGQTAAAVATAWRGWREARERREEAESGARRIAAEREGLAWQVKELEALAFRAEEWDALEAEHARQHHAAGLLEAAGGAVEALADDPQSALARLNAVIARLGKLSGVDPQLAPVLDVLDSARIHVQEAVHALERYRDRLDTDPRQLEALERRMEAVHAICRKYRVRPAELAELAAGSAARLAELDRDLDLEGLRSAEAAAQAAYRAEAAKLSAGRRKAAAKLGRQVTRALQDLAMTGARFEVSLESLPDGGAGGDERVEFRIAAHAGTEPGPLAKVASGGELSRVSLAIQTALSQVAGVPTLVFDEVDAGIGGGVAEIVGRMLRALGVRYQVLCVTHLAQVAACADHHWRVEKSAAQGRVTSRVSVLDGQARCEEIARMLGGVSITETTRRHAGEMLARAAGP